MKPWIFEVMVDIIGDAKCNTVAEIGTHNGGTAQQLISLLAPRVEKLMYYGYDIFDADNPDLEFHKQERNGKAPASYDQALYTLRKISKRLGNIEYTLFKGFTTDTLVTPQVFDFVYIDGGHSYDTVKHDYSMVKDSKLIVFDDYKIPGVQQAVTEIEATGVAVEIVSTPSKHTWAVIRN